MHSDITFQYLPGKRPRQTVYFENIVNNFIFIDEDGTASADVAKDGAAATASEQKPKRDDEIGVGAA